MADRERWFVKNIGAQEISLGDLPKVPSITRNHSVDILYYETKDRIGLSKALRYVFRKNICTFEKEIDGVRTKFTGAAAIEAVSGVEENELDDGTGTGYVTVKDEGDLVNDVTTEMNFIGEDVLAKKSGPHSVNIYIPAPDFASNYNTSNGNTDATVDDFSTTQRYVSDPTSEGTPFKIGDWNAGDLIPAHESGSISYSSNDFSIYDMATTFEVVVYDADGTTELANHTIDLIGNIDIISDSIRIEITGFSQDSVRYKASSNVNIDIATLLPDGGRYSIKITHYNGTEGTYTKEQNDIFYDANSNTASISGPSFSENSAALKYLSGVMYYDINSLFNVGISDIDWLNDSTFPLIQVRIDGDELGLPDLNLEGTDLTDWTNAWDNQDASYASSSWEIIDSNLYIISTTANASAVAIDWSEVSSLDFADYPILVNTYADNATRVFEDFRSETYRLTSAFTGWDSTQNLNSYDGGIALQVSGDLAGSGSRLIYPSVDYTVYNPNSGSQPNYAGLSGNRYYYRRFWHNNTSHSNGTFLLSDYNITEGNLSDDSVLIEISLNGSDWFNCNESYLGGALSPGDGCRINSDTLNLTSNDQIQFTLGTGGFTDASTGGGWGIYFRIRITDTASSVYLGVIQIIDWV